MIPPLFGKQEVGIWRIQKLFPQYGVPIWSLWPSCLPTLLIFIHIEHICSFFVAFFSATIDGRNLMFGHKLHIGTPYCGKSFWIRQIPTSCLPPTIWYTYMMLVTKYQISAINSCWEKCDEKCAYMFNVYKNQLFGHKHHIGIPYRG
jgi:hypothetical protein